MRDSHKYPALDGLRAIAILLVLARHGVKPFWENIKTPFLQVGSIDLAPLFLNGDIGVDLFFILSGFLISNHLLQALADGKMRKQKTMHYFKRRFYRIAPAFYVVLTLVTAAVVAGILNAPIPAGQALSTHYAAHVFFIQDLYPPNILPVFWSLAVEAKFYLIAPVLVICLLHFKSWKSRLLILLLAIGLGMFARWNIASSSFADGADYIAWFEHFRSRSFLSLDGLLAGTCVAVLWQDQSVKRWLQASYVSNLLFVAGLVVVGIFGFFSTPFDVKAGFLAIIFKPSLLALGWGLVTLALLGGSVGSGFLGGSVFRYIAKISYSLYLTHFPLVFLTTAGLLFLSKGNSVPWFYIMLVWLSLSFAISALLYKFIEKPFIDWSKKT